MYVRGEGEVVIRSGMRVENEEGNEERGGREGGGRERRKVGSSEGKGNGSVRRNDDA